MTVQDDLISFAEEPAKTLDANATPWRVLVVDDDGEVHQATRYALENVHLLGVGSRLIVNFFNK